MLPIAEYAAGIDTIQKSNLTERQKADEVLNLNMLFVKDNPYYTLVEGKVTPTGYGEAGDSGAAAPSLAPAAKPPVYNADFKKLDTYTAPPAQQITKGEAILAAMSQSPAAAASILGALGKGALAGVGETLKYGKNADPSVVTAPVLAQAKAIQQDVQAYKSDPIAYKAAQAQAQATPAAPQAQDFTGLNSYSKGMPAFVTPKIEVLPDGSEVVTIAGDSLRKALMGYYEAGAARVSTSPVVDNKGVPSSGMSATVTREPLNPKAFAPSGREIVDKSYMDTYKATLDRLSKK